MLPTNTTNTTNTHALILAATALDNELQRLQQINAVLTDKVHLLELQAEALEAHEKTLHQQHQVHVSLLRSELDALDRKLVTRKHKKAKKRKFDKQSLSTKGDDTVQKRLAKEQAEERPADKGPQPEHAEGAMAAEERASDQTSVNAAVNQPEPPPASGDPLSKEESEQKERQQEKLRSFFETSEDVQQYRDSLMVCKGSISCNCRQCR